MGEAVTIQVQFDGFGLNKPVTFNARDWWVHETNGVQLLTIQDKESSETTHDIPLASVLYWSTKPCDDADISAHDRYCDTCKIYFTEDGTVFAYTHKEHDVRRVCCGASPQRDHHPSCTAGDFSSQQRDTEKRSFHVYNQLDQIVKIDDPHNPASPYFATFNPDPNQPGVG